MRTFAVTSGKGGVGKTNLSANLAIALAQRGLRTLVFDADLGLANLDVVLGTRAPHTLQDVIAGEKRLLEIATPGPGGIQFVAGGSGVQALVNLAPAQLDSFLCQLSELEECMDVLIFDTGAGIDNNTMTFLEAADDVLLISTPDPASITDAYATAKTLFARKPNAKVHVVLNMVSDETQARAVYAKLFSITQQFLEKSLTYAGMVRNDPHAVAWIRKRQPFLLAQPNLAASQDVARLAANLLGKQHTPSAESLVDRLRAVFSIGVKRPA